MIELFTVKNYMSYRDEVQLSFEASKKEKGNQLPPEWYKIIDGKRILRLLLCVGLNGTGKTKMIEALQYLRMLVISRPEKPSDKPLYRPFMLDDFSRNEPTELSLTYYLNDTRYMYFIKVSKDMVVEEELKILVGHVQKVFKREFDKETNKVAISFGSGCDLSKEERHDLELNLLKNSSVLSVFGQLNLNSQVLKDNYAYFENRISFVRKSNELSIADKLSTGDQERDSKVKVLLLQLLNDVGTNICDYEVDEISFNISEIEKTAPEVILTQLNKSFPNGVINHKFLRFIHKTVEGKRGLDIESESLGTKSIIKLLLVIYDIVLGKKCACIDEIEYGVHTKALTFLLKMYLTIADECQFVVTTHDLSLLNTDFLRRDAVRMFEKNEHGETRIMKRLYVHSTMNYLKAYEKLLDEQLGLADIDIEAMEKYRGMIHDYLSMQTADVP